MLVATTLGALAALAIGQRAGKDNGPAATAPGYNQRQARIAIGAGDRPDRPARSVTVAGGCPPSGGAHSATVGCRAGLDFELGA